VFHKNAYGTGDWQWHWCKPALPNIPKFNPGAPRPPLADKKSDWCTKSVVPMGDGTGWYRDRAEKVDLTLWPDYWRYRFVSVQWNAGTKQWIYTQTPQYTYTDCDA
jgi:hypothetical protein